MPVAAQVQRHALERPHQPALCGPGGSLTYAELWREVLARPLPVKGKGLVAITLSDPVDQLVAVLAADLAGATPLLCDGDQRARVAATLPVDLHVDTPLPATGAAGGTAEITPGITVEPDGDDLVWACLTSGSTGSPRAVVRTRRSWAGSFPHVSALAGIGADDVVLVPGPLVSSLYGFAAVHALAAGATVVVPGRWSPGSLTVQLRRATVVHLVPHRLPAVLDVLEEVGGPLRTAMVGGAALPPHAREMAARAGVRVVSYYGATEMSFVAADADGTGLRPFPEVEIQVRDGEVWARSPWLAEGYVAGAKGPMKTDGAGWMSVGDLAEPYEPGRPLRLRGRGDGAIQTGGATVVPEDVEAVLRDVPGVRDIVVIGSPHPQLGSVVTAVLEGSPPPRAALEAVARGRLDAAQRPRRWYAVGDLPRTPTGKPARGLVAARLAGGDPQIRRLV
ncbi:MULTISPECIES: class I adenylate-forming enzyme family protein [Nonomuraea]|uniref:Class I adenylate-forming enzyme family protein n=1 Tax=Nonomuraea mangrovi TaxID=2316207 RepID=A0ABW4T7A7_9ACTN